MALQVVHSSTDGFSTGVAVRPRVQFDVSGKYEEEGDDCRKGVPLKRKNGIGSSSPGPVRKAEPVGCVSERLHLFPREEGCRGRHREAAIVVACYREGHIEERGTNVLVISLWLDRIRPISIYFAIFISREPAIYTCTVLEFAGGGSVNFLRMMGSSYA